MMDLQDKIIKWILAVIIFSLAGVIIAIFLLILNLVLKDFNFTDGINSGIISAAGGIIGGSLTLIGVRATLKQDKKKNVENGRSYVSIQNMVLAYDLSKIQMDGKKRVVETEYYKDLRKSYPEGKYKDNQMVYYKLNHFGSPHFVFEVKVKITFLDESIIRTNIGIVEKDEIILIPLWAQGIPWKYDTNVVSVETIYHTEVGENIVYRIYYKDTFVHEQYFSVVDGKEKIIRKNEPAEDQTWILLN